MQILFAQRMPKPCKRSSGTTKIVWLLLITHHFLVTINAINGHISIEKRSGRRVKRWDEEPDDPLAALPAAPVVKEEPQEHESAAAVASNQAAVIDNQHAQPSATTAAATTTKTEKTTAKKRRYFVQRGAANQEEAQFLEKKSTEERLRRTKIKEDIQKLRDLLGGLTDKRVPKVKILLNAIDRIRYLCQELLLWKNHDEEMHKMQKGFIAYLELLHHEMESSQKGQPEKLAGFTQPMLPWLPEIDKYLANKEVDPHEIMGTLQQNDAVKQIDDEGKETDASEKSDLITVKTKTNPKNKHAIVERNRLKQQDALLNALQQLIPKSILRQQKLSKRDLIETVIIYIEELQSLQSKHEFAEQLYAKVLADYTHYNQAMKQVFNEKGVPMPTPPVLEFTETRKQQSPLKAEENEEEEEMPMPKRRRAKIGGKKQQSLSTAEVKEEEDEMPLSKWKRAKVGGKKQQTLPTGSKSSSGNVGFQEMPPELPAVSYSHLLHLMDSGTGYTSSAAFLGPQQPSASVPLASDLEASSSQQQHSGSAALWSATTDDDEMDHDEVKELKMALREHKIKQEELETIISQQKALIDQQNARNEQNAFNHKELHALNGIVVKQLMDVNSKKSQVLDGIGIQPLDNDLAIADPLPEDRKQKYPLIEADTSTGEQQQQQQQLPIAQAVNLSDLAIRLTLLPTLPNAKVREQFMSTRDLLLAENLYETWAGDQLNCFLLFHSRPILQLSPTQIRQSIEVFKPVRTVAANMLDLLVKKVEEDSSFLRSEWATLNEEASTPNHLEPMWNLHFYHHIFQAVLARLPNKTEKEAENEETATSTTKEQTMLANARKFLLMTIDHIDKDLTIFENQSFMEERLAKRRSECDDK